VTNKGKALPVEPTLPAKTCTKCGELKFLTEYSKMSTGRFGVKPRCKACLSEEYKEYRADNLEAESLRKKRWKSENKERVAAVQRTYEQANKERIALTKKEYYRENPDLLTARGRAYRAKYPERASEDARRRRAFKLGNGAEPYTVAEMLLLYGTDCYLCSEPIDMTVSGKTNLAGWEQGLHIDHVQPLSKGGPDSLANVRPAHGLCNLKKHDTWDDTDPA
jgi:5-methylcytosine-specific restriction endonuclease McrA